MPRGRSGRPWRRIRQEVLARGGVCCRCGQPVDVTLPYRGIDGHPDPEAASVDHLLPLSLYPEFAESLDHLAIAHNRCNISAQNSIGTFAGQPSEDW